MARKLSAHTVAVNERRAAAIALRMAGKPWQSIADELGYKSKGAACQDVSRALEAVIKVPAEEYVNEEVARLDNLLGTVYPLAIGGDMTAVDRVLAIMRQRSKYLGLDKLPPSAEISNLDGRITISFATPAPSADADRADILELPPEDAEDPGE